MYLHRSNLPMPWLSCAVGGRSIYSYPFSWGQHLYPYMNLLSFVWKSWTVGHQPRCCGYPLPVDGKHWFPLAGVPPSKIGPHFLHSGGSMTLHQDGISDSNIKAIGWRRSESFPIYPQGQLLLFNIFSMDCTKDVMWFSSTAQSFFYSSLNCWLRIGPFLCSVPFPCSVAFIFSSFFLRSIWVTDPVTMGIYVRVWATEFLSFSNPLYI